MADPAVVALVKARLADVPAMPPLPILETLNVRPTALPDAFLTIEHDHSETTRITLGIPTQFREDGALNILVHVRAGIGDTDAFTIAELVRSIFHNYMVGHFRVLQAKSAVITQPDDGNFFEAKVPLDYQYDFFA